MMTTLISTAIYEPLIICQVIFYIKYFSPLNNPRKEGNIIPQNLPTESLSILVKSQLASANPRSEPDIC